MSIPRRLRYLLLPYLLVLLCAMAVLGFVQGGLVLTWHLFAADARTMIFWFPIAVGAIFASVLIMPRIRRVSVSREPTRFIFFHLLTIAVIAVPLIQSQRLVDAWFKPLVQLESAQPSGVPHGYYFDIRNAETFHDMRINRRGIADNGLKGQMLYLEVLHPLTDPHSLHISVVDTPLFYVAHQYQKPLYKAVDSLALNQLFQAWEDSIYTTEDAFDPGAVTWYSRISDPFRYLLAHDALKIRGIPLYRDSLILLEPHGEPFVSAVPVLLMVWAGVSLLSIGIWFLVCISIKVNAPGETAPVKRSTGKGFAGIFIPRKGYMVTPILICLNLVMYLICAIASGNALQFSPAVLAALGGNVPSLTSGGMQYWRLFTCIFLHGGLMHFLANMYGLYILGRLIEPLLRTQRFILIYMLAGLMGSAASLLVFPGDAVRIGASGAIFGLMGLLTALALTPLFPPEIRRNLLKSMLTTLVINLLISLTPGIDYSAHVGGLLCGAMFGFLWYPWLKSRLKKGPGEA